MDASVPDEIVAQLLKEEFLSWRPYHLILARLKHLYGIQRSLSWLKRRLKVLRLSKRKVDPPLRALSQLLKVLLRTSDSLGGYRMVWKLLRDRYGIIVRRDTIMKVMAEIDPLGVAERRKRRLRRRMYRNPGPNFVWHLDGYDKLSCFGLKIHGCIDGFSRRILWLKLSTTNHDPCVVAQYFLSCIEQVKGCPRLIRADRGTENVHVAALQIAFRFNHNDSLRREKSFVYGSSTTNTRIESWWSRFRLFKVHWWIDLLNGLQIRGLYNAENILHKWILLYTVAHILEQEMDEFVAFWNSHHIRHNRLAGCPGGIPEDLYKMPQHYGSSNYICDANPDIWLHGMRQIASAPAPFYPQEFGRLSDEALRKISMTREDINALNCKLIYAYLLVSLTDF